MTLATDRRQRVRRLKLRLALLAGVVLAIGPPAFGEEEGEETPSHRSGPYVGVNLAGALPNFEGSTLFVNPSPTRPSVAEEPSFGINARAGWRLLPYLAAEVQYEWVDEWEIRTRDVTCAIASAQVVTGNLRLLAPFRVVQPYLLAGVGAGSYERAVTGNELGLGLTCEPVPGEGFQSSAWELAGRFGGGFDVYVSDHLVLNLEVTTLYSDEQLLGTSFPYVSLSGGFQYRF